MNQPEGKSLNPEQSPTILKALPIDSHPTVTGWVGDSSCWTLNPGPFSPPQLIYLCMHACMHRQ